jgi:hypothetical protein
MAEPPSPLLESKSDWNISIRINSGFLISVFKFRIKTYHSNNFGKTWVSRRNISDTSATSLEIKREWYVCMYSNKNPLVFLDEIDDSGISV